MDTETGSESVDYTADHGFIDPNEPTVNEETPDDSTADDGELETEADAGDGDGDAGESDAGETESSDDETAEAGETAEEEIEVPKLAKANKHDAELLRIQKELNKPLPKKPELDDFDDYEAYEDARAEYRLDLRERRKLEERATELGRDIGQMIERNLKAAEAAMARRHKDYGRVQDAFFGNEEVYMNPAIVELLKQADTPEDAGRVVYTIGKKLDEVRELLSSANPIVAGMKLAQMIQPRSERVAKTAEKKLEVVPKKPVSKPIKSGGNGAKLDPFENDLDFAEFERRVRSNPKVKQLFQRTR